MHIDALFCIEGITFNCAIGACARAKRPGIYREGGGLIRNHSKVSFENLGAVFFVLSCKNGTEFPACYSHIGKSQWSFPSPPGGKKHWCSCAFLSGTIFSIRIAPNAMTLASDKCLFFFFHGFSFSIQVFLFNACLPYRTPSPEILQDVSTSLAGVTCEALVMYQIMSPTRPKLILCLEVHIIFFNFCEKSHRHHSNQEFGLSAKYI